MTMSPEQVANLVNRVLDGGDTPGKDFERSMAVQAHESLASFIKQMWPCLEPGTPLTWTWYHDLMCNELEKVVRGEREEIVICIPPGFAKSLFVAVFFPAWWWLRDPTRSFLATSSADDLVLRDNQRMRDVVTHEWYQKLVKQVAKFYGKKDWSLTKDQNQKKRFLNTEGGQRMCFTISGSPTGHRAHVQIIDDPVQAKEVIGTPEQVETRLDEVWAKINVVMASRFMVPKHPIRIFIMQRLHDLDPAGRAMAEQEEDDELTTSIVLPMEFDPTREDIHPDDPRTEHGELLDEERMPRPVVDKLVRKLRTVAGQDEAQLNQRCIPSEGGIFKRGWMQNRYDFDPMRNDIGFKVAITVDTTFKKGPRTDKVSMQAWGIKGTQRYLLAEVFDRMDYVEFKNTLRDFYVAWRPFIVLVEAKANGEAVIVDLRKVVPCLVGFTPDRHGDKVSRAQLSTGVWAAGNVWLPMPEWMPSVGAYQADLLGFPQRGRDRTDSMTQLFLWLHENMDATAEGYVLGVERLVELLSAPTGPQLPGMGLAGLL